MPNTVDPVLSHHTSQERQPAAVPELQNDQPHQLPKQSQADDQLPKQSQADDLAEQIEAASGDHC